MRNAVHSHGTTIEKSPFLSISVSSVYEVVYVVLTIGFAANLPVFLLNIVVFNLFILMVMPFTMCLPFVHVVFVALEIVWAEHHHRLPSFAFPSRTRIALSFNPTSPHPLDITFHVISCAYIGTFPRSWHGQRPRSRREPSSRLGGSLELCRKRPLYSRSSRE